MRRKGPFSTLHTVSTMRIYAVFCILGFITTKVNGETTADTSSNSVGDSATCQCGVFLLGSGTLTFASDAKPVLAGLPVSANCSASDDRISCATICRQLIQAMSGNQENTPLVQTVVLAATRTLACQRFNESHKVPAPRNFEGTNRQTLAQLDEQKKWKFFIGPSPHGARSDVATENNGNAASNSNSDSEDDTNNAALTEPKWLGGYYRWCDEHWIYAGVSLHEPLCCQGHVPKRCPNYHPEESATQKSARNGRRPRLIVIKRCPNNVCVDEEDEDLEPSSGESSNKVSPTSLTRPSFDDGEEETEAPDTGDKDEETDDDEAQKEAESEDNDTSSETINPYTTPSPVPSKPLNATVMSEALKFFETLMEGLGYGEIFEGVRSVLPETTAVQLLERINHGGWLTHYQDRYIKWPREFSLGYCYLEYSMYNVKNEGGLVPATQSLLERMFGPDRPLPPIGARLPQPPQAPQAVPPSPNPYDNGLGGELTNYIQPIPQMPGNSFGAYEQYDHSRIPGNRRVRRGVSVSRSYSSSPDSRVTGRSSGANNSGPARRRNQVRRVKPQSRTAPLPYESQQSPLPYQSQQSPLPYQSQQSPLPYESQQSPRSYHHSMTDPHVQAAAPSTSSQYVPLRTIEPNYNNDGNSQRQSSFVPTHPESSSVQERYSSVFPKVYRNNVPYSAETYQHNSPSRRSHLENGNNNVNLAEIARPRRHPGGEEVIEDRNLATTGSQRGPMGPPPPLPPQRKQATTAKDGPSAGNLLNIANMLMQTAMAGSGNNEGDKVTNMMQTAIPLVAQVANNPAVHSMVNNLVTTFLTPPNSNGPPPPPPPRPTRPDPEDNWGPSGGSSSSSNKRPVTSKNPLRDSEEVSSNEIDEPEVTSSNTKPVNVRPPPSSGGGASEMIASMVQNMVSSYIKHIFSPGPGRPPRPSHKPGSSSSNSSPNDKLGTDKPAGSDSTESNDIVDVIANAAKPFFISTFGVVPGDPGYGRLLNRRRDEYKRHGGTSKGHNPNDILTEDPDPGTGIFDIIVGPPNFPETGNKVYDFGNRVVYGFTNANDPHHGVYCFKQYFVNKVWDYFRLGVRAVFK